MRYLSFFTPDPSAGPPTAAHRLEMRTFAEEMLKSGVLVATGGFLPGALGARVLQRNGSIRVQDGANEPAPSHEGFALLEVASKEAAIEVTRRFLKLAGDGECALFALVDGAPPGN
ncbi:MAG TPA: hypothetical protein VMR31_09565 [Myxococcota bacterium]|nr:hypothetical protein [Myxococcota bacterium]